MLEAHRTRATSLAVLQDEALALERVERGRARVLRERLDLRQVEALADDARELQGAFLLRIEAIDARREKRDDRLRDSDRRRIRRCLPAATFLDHPAVLDQHAQELLTEQRISLRPRGDLRPKRRGEIVDVEQS